MKSISGNQEVKRTSAQYRLAPFLFKLHSPLNYIAGGGFFLRQSFLPLTLAWEIFGAKNGCRDFADFQSRILTYRARSGKTDRDPTIGCLVLIEPFFFEERDWIPVEAASFRSIVVGKTMNTVNDADRRLWEQVQERLAQLRPIQEAAVTPAQSQESLRYGAEFLTRARLGQGSFRVLVTEAYTRRCAMTGEKTLPVLQAAHIKPYGASGPHSIQNGLLLRSDLHILFDRGYVTVNPDLKVEVSARIKEEFSNGREYYALHGKPLTIVPPSMADRPAADFLDWHNTNVYKG